MPATSKLPVDISGLQNALSSRQVSVADEVADALATLRELRKMRKELLEKKMYPSKVDIFTANMCVKTLQACSTLMKSRPELVGKSAGKVASEDLITDKNGVPPSHRTNNDPDIRLPTPEGYDDDA